MKRLLPVLMGFALLLLSPTEGWSLPPCPGSPTSGWDPPSNWTDCFGTFTYSNGIKYVGEYKDGKEHGQGTLTYANGNKYVGEWKDGEYHGQGTFTLADGTVIREGIWENGDLKYAKKSPTKGSSLPPCPGSPASSWSTVYNWTYCVGTYISGMGNYVGEWKGGIRHGQGTMTFADGNKYVGEWDNGNYHGQGTQTYADGRVREGIWEYGRFLYAKKPSPTVIGTSEKTPKVKLKPAKQVATKTPKPKTPQFKKVAKRPDDIAVIIANSNYQKLGKGIPNVKPAYTDAENIKKYFMESLGVREGNIIFEKDATRAQLMSIFGSNDDHRGKLFNWTKQNVSKVYVYYAGHGAPAGDKGTTYLVPSDADSETVQLTGYPLKQLYRNLGKVPATSITVILEACFSGQSQSGYLSSQTSGIRVVPIMPSAPKKITVISAGAANQVATWEKNGSQSLFTKYFLKGMSGEGDKKPYGNGNGKVSLRELKKYLDGNMTYYARRYYGRTQQAQIVVNGKELSPTN